MFSHNVKRLAILFKYQPRKTRWLKKKYEKTFSKLIEETDFLSSVSSIQERCWYIVHNINSQLLCNQCGLTKVGFNRTTKIPNKFCCSGCTSKNKITKEKKKLSAQLKYGVDNVFKNEEIKQKIKTTLLTKYGVDNISKNEEIKQKKIKTCLKNNNVAHGIELSTPLSIQQKHGVDNISKLSKVKQKKKLSAQQKYGVDNVFQSEEIKTKIKETLLNRYGVDNISQDEETKIKIKETVLKKHGVNNISQSEEIKNKIKETNFSKYGVHHPNQRHITTDNIEKLNSKEWLHEEHINNSKSLTQIAKELQVTVTTVSRKMDEFKIEKQYYFSSTFEYDIINFIKTLLPTDEVITNTRTIIPPFELDIFIPSHNVAIECDGLYWHSELVNNNKNYHIQKTNTCNDNGIKLIHIFENEWNLKQDIVMSRLATIINSPLYKIHARKCLVKTISSHEGYEFLNNNHIQGGIKSEISQGLYYDNELVAVMTFGKTRYNKKYQYELIRFANKLNTSVIGGASKLFKNFIKQYNPDSVISYSDKRWNTGKVYKNLNFTFSHQSPPNYWYFKNNDFQLLSRIQFQKHKLKDKLEIFDPKLTEWQNMVNNGYNRIWDCGNDVFIWKK